MTSSALSRVSLATLAILRSGPLHGYGIRQEIQALTSGRLIPSTANMYETIEKLRAAGLVDRDGDEVLSGALVRKRYRLTSAGNAALDQEFVELDQIRLRARAPKPS